MWSLPLVVASPPNLVVVAEAIRHRRLISPPGVLRQVTDQVRLEDNAPSPEIWVEWDGKRYLLRWHKSGPHNLGQYITFESFPDGFLFFRKVG
jgi:hypothetical protein